MHRTHRPLLALLLLGVLLGSGYLMSAIRSQDGSRSAAATTGPGTAAPASGLRTVRAGDLPAEARQVLQLIDAGGPFRYAQDGSVFGNLERRLPARSRGWYREYTVPTSGESDRGARRIVAGQDGVRYYTADHYESFARVEDP